jgi:hypothetical protein
VAAVTCPWCGAVWCYEGGHEPGQALPQCCPVCRCTTYAGHDRVRFTEDEALRIVRTSYMRRLERVYPCGGHFHISSQVRAGLRVTRRGERGAGTWLDPGEPLPPGLGEPA